ncbi:MAG: hypothetical protein ACLFPE_10645 [Bacteroidales bacterium]
MKITKIILFSLALMFVFASCKKDVNNEVDPQVNEGMENLNVNPNFDWKTTKVYVVEFTAYANSLVRITDQDGKLLKVAMLNKENATSVQFSAPAYLNKVNLSFLGNDADLELSGNSLTYSFK